jgi:hypothetical protein
MYHAGPRWIGMLTVFNVKSRDTPSVIPGIGVVVVISVTSPENVSTPVGR